MSLHYIYSNASNSTQDITAYCRLYQYSATTDAKEGSVAHSTLVVDDPDGTLDFIGHRRLYTYEDLAPTNQKVVHNGYIQRETVSRGPYRTGAGRIWTLDLADTNVLLNRRLMNGTDASRPIETDVARIVALETMTELNTFDDFLYVNLAAASNTMDAVDYRTQPALAYIDDCAQSSGKNYFGWYRESTGDNSLWYDFAKSSNWQGTKRLSNVLADVDDLTTFAVDMEHDAELDRDPSRVASGIMLPFDGVAVGSNTINGTVYVQNPTTTATFAAIDWLAPSVNVKTKAKALARADRYLMDATEEDDLIHCSVKLPSANVNDFMAGMRFDAKFSHLPGYEDFTSLRCLSRTVTEISEDPTRAYRLDLELSPTVVPGDVYLMSFMALRAGSPQVETVRPKGKTVCGAAPDLTDWAEPNSASARAGDDYPMFFSSRVASTTSEPMFNAWFNVDGGARPVIYSLQIAGATGPPVLLGNASFQSGAFTSPSVTVPEQGWLFMLLSMSSGVAPGDFGGSYAFVPSTSGIVEIGQQYAPPTFAPRSWFGYLPVTAGSRSLALTYSGSNPFAHDDGWGCILVFVPGTSLSLADTVIYDSAVAATCWEWNVAP